MGAAAGWAQSVPVMSNLQKGASVFLVQDAKSKTPERLVRFDMGAKKFENLPWSSEIGSEEVLGLLLLSDRLLLISQWTAGGGKTPHLHTYLLKEKKWAAVKDLPCISFDKVTIKGGQLTVNCEEDYLKKTKAGDQSIAIETAKSEKLSVTLPLTKVTEGKRELAMVGSAPAKAVKYSTASSSKTLTAEELLKTK